MAVINLFLNYDVDFLAQDFETQNEQFWQARIFKGRARSIRQVLRKIKIRFWKIAFCDRVTGLKQLRNDRK